MTTAMQIANYIRQTKPTYGKMHVMKLVYYVQGWSLAWTGKPIFDETLEAWEHGPVAPSVHRGWTIVKPQEEVHLPPNDKAITDAVFAFYGRCSGATLREMTHREDPWIAARGSLKEGDWGNDPILTRDIRNYFAKLAATGGKVPVAPLLDESDTTNASLFGALERQRNKWRGTLDALALR